MTGMASCRDIRQALGVYVLGAIDPAERAQVDEHLATCPECREELASLAGLPAMLRKVPVVEAERLAAEGEPDVIEMPSEQMLTSLVARTSNVRRMHRWRGVAAAAAAVLVAFGGGAAIATAVQSSSSPSIAAVHWRTASGGTAGIHLRVMYRQVESGSLIKANVTGAPDGAVCELQVVDSHGQVMPLGSWQFWHGSVWYPASTALGEASLHTFELTIGGKVVASAPA